MKLLTGGKLYGQQDRIQKQDPYFPFDPYSGRVYDSAGPRL